VPFPIIEPDVETSSLRQAIFWRDTYREVLGIGEAVMARAVELSAGLSGAARHEAEMSHFPAMAVQVDRSRFRLGCWQDRLNQVLSEPDPLTGLNGRRE
jgi:hypothetical protein